MRYLGLFIILFLLLPSVTVAGILDETGALSVQVSPSIAKVGESVEIVVTTKLKGEPVQGAEIKVVKLKPEETI